MTVGRRKEYEDAFQTWQNSAGAWAFTRGRHALVILLRALKIGPGDKVGICAFTCLNVVEAVRVCGAEPHYLDVDEHLCIDPAAILAVPPGNLKVVVLQHTFGNPGRLDDLLAACRQQGAAVIEDCAHALDCFWKGIPLGRFGEGALFSFQWGKPYTTGQGGMLSVNTAALADVVGSEVTKWAHPTPVLSDWMLSIKRFCFDRLYGTAADAMLRKNYFRLKGHWSSSRADCALPEFRLTPNYIQYAGERMAAAGLRQLRDWPRLRAIRRQNAHMIRDALTESGIPAWPVPVEADITFLRYPLLTARKADIISSSRRHGMDIGGWYRSPVHPLTGKALMRVGYVKGSCPRAEWIIDRLIHLPTGRNMDARRLEMGMRILKEGRSTARYSVGI